MVLEARRLEQLALLERHETILREEVIVIIGGRLAELLLDLHQVAAANDAHRDFLRACAGGERGSEAPGVSERSWGARRATGWTRSTVPRNGRAAGRMDGVPAPARSVGSGCASHRLKVLHELQHRLVRLLRGEKVGDGSEVSPELSERRPIAVGSGRGRVAGAVAARAPCGGWSGSRPHRKGRGSSRSSGALRRTSSRLRVACGPCR